MPEWVVIAIALVVLAASLQVLIPRVGEGRVARRLVEHGGEASVEISAFPALKLLRRDGDRLMVRGRGLAIGMSRQGGGLAAIDGFGHVDIVLTEFTTGPFQVAEFVLTRIGGGPYRMRSEVLISGAALAHYGGEQLGGPVPLLAVLARQAPLGERSFPIAVEVELESRDGIVVVASGAGTIAGYPAGPVATTIAAAVVRRLEISF
jgi:hypothetical protein